jgi:hypothetical protein
VGLKLNNTCKKKLSIFRRLIVYPRIQVLSLIYIAGFGALSSLSTVLMASMMASPENQTPKIIALAIGSFVGGVIILGLSLVFTNRFLGPIFRLNAEIQRALQEDYKPEPLNLRKRDYFSDLAENYSRLVEKIDARKEEGS